MPDFYIDIIKFSVTTQYTYVHILFLIITMDNKRK